MTKNYLKYHLCYSDRNYSNNYNYNTTTRIVRFIDDNWKIKMLTTSNANYNGQMGRFLYNYNINNIYRRQFVQDIT